ncbi:MAG: hypothetical protein JWR24_4087 [Actinoallomurus sp.]|jgi:deoxyribodipyrimidine photo-lyase|nr:hypothetical protein [Actinoallomurus sp.]
MSVAICLFTAGPRRRVDPVPRGALGAADQVVPLFVLDDGVRADGLARFRRARTAR